MQTRIIDPQTGSRFVVAVEDINISKFDDFIRDFNQLVAHNARLVFLNNLLQEQIALELS
jgi:hypothetical protein